MLQSKSAEFVLAEEMTLNEIQSGLFFVYLQPKVNLETEEFIAAEALVRKTAENGNKISPNAFIPFYEQNGTIKYLDFFVIEEVCKFLKKLIIEDKALQIAVNLSGTTFLDPDLVSDVVAICARYKIPHKYLKIEVAESIDEMDLDFLNSQIGEFKKVGFEISLDNFGAKLSNLLMLTGTEFDEVKIDKSLMENITKNPKNKALVRNILNMLDEIGTFSCVVGIETREQKDLLSSYECTHGQGYYFFQPMSISEFIGIYDTNIEKSFIKNNLTEDSSFMFPLGYNEMTAVLDSMSFCVTLFNEKFEIISCNQQTLTTFGFNSKEEYLQSFFSQSPKFQPDGQDSVQLTLELLQQAFQGEYLRFPWLFKSKQGTEFSAEVSLLKIKAKMKKNEESPIVAAFFREVNPENIDKSSWVQNYEYNNGVSDKELISSLLEISSEWLWTYNYDTGQMMFFGEGYEEFELPCDKFLFPKTILERNLIHEEDMDNFKIVCKALMRGEHIPIELRLNVPDKGPYFYRSDYRIIKNMFGKPQVAIGKCVNIEDEKQLSMLNFDDEFSISCNEKLSEILIMKAIDNDKDSNHALFLFKIDQHLNDQNLDNLTNNIRTCFRPRDIVGKISSDSFIVFLRNYPDLGLIKNKASLINKMLEKICLETNVEIDNNLGIALYPNHGKNYKNLYNMAETALHKAKTDNSKNYAIFSEQD